MEEEKKYNYFVSYYFTERNGSCGLANGTFTLKEKLNDIEKLARLTEYIEDKYHYKTATILNFIKLEE